jgi:hypothetical protein
MNGTPPLLANGFGRFEQQIVFSIQHERQESMLDNLDIAQLDDHLSPPSVSYVWRRWSIRKGDDEDIVMELSDTLGINEIDWQIDWARSLY